MTDPTYLASIYRLEATIFRQSAEVLAAAFPTPITERPGSRGALPFYYLVSHAAELLLKAALLKRECSESDLKSLRLRHSLANLLAEVEARGVGITSSCATLICDLSPQHEHHALRYTALVDDGKPTVMPPPKLVFDALDELLLCTRLSVPPA